MNILLTGASGLLGAAFAGLASREGHALCGVVHAAAGKVPGLTEQVALDLARPAGLGALLARCRPDAIVNCAAISAIGRCVAEPAAAHHVNVALPAALAGFARQTGTRFIHVSSEQVFDGTRRTPYRPGDPTAPVNSYGRLKVESEQRVHAAAPAEAVTVRPPLLLGNSLGGSRGLHEQLLASCMAGTAPRLFDDEFRQPCTATNLAAVLLELCARRDLTGIFHWAGTDLVSRFELGRRILAHFRLGAPAAVVLPQSRLALPELARARPACLAQDTTALASTIRTRPESLDEQLATLRVPAPCRDWHQAVST